MDSGTIWAIGLVALAVMISCGILARALHGVPEGWAIFGAVISAVGVVVSIAGLIIQHADAIRPSPGAEVQSTPSATSVTSASTGVAPSPGVTSLPANSPLRKRILAMDQVCADLGLSLHAWLPGQTSAISITGRIILAAGAAYTWSCTKNGPKLTRKQITQGCQIWYPDTKAYTWDSSNAYSWVCIKS